MNNQRLYQLREYNNLTQQKIADILKVKQQTYFDWEKGNKIIPLKHLVTLAKFYQVSIDYLIGLSDDPSITYKYHQLDRKKIGKRLIIIRNLHNLYQKDLAASINANPSTICSYEKGKTTIITAFAYAIALKYNISIDWLIGASPYMLRAKKRTYVNS